MPSLRAELARLVLRMIRDGREARAYSLRPGTIVQSMRRSCLTSWPKVSTDGAKRLGGGLLGVLVGPARLVPKTLVENTQLIDSMTSKDFGESIEIGVATPLLYHELLSN